MSGGLQQRRCPGLQPGVSPAALLISAAGSGAAVIRY